MEIVPNEGHRAPFDVSTKEGETIWKSTDNPSSLNVVPPPVFPFHFFIQFDNDEPVLIKENTPEVTINLKSTDPNGNWICFTDNATKKSFKLILAQKK